MQETNKEAILFYIKQIMRLHYTEVVYFRKSNFILDLYQTVQLIQYCFTFEVECSVNCVNCLIKSFYVSTIFLCFPLLCM